MAASDSVSTLIELLTPIWQRALHRPSIGADDNFFQLGGDPVAASQIFEDFAQATGRNIPPFLIYQAPTINSLAGYLSAEPLKPFPPLVMLENGNDQPPIFVAHGIGSHLMEFFQFARQMKVSQPIFALQLPGMEGATQPLNRVEAMADHFLSFIREAQPHGPYCLIGYSFGGLVSLEIARRIKQSGEAVEALILVESYPPRETIPFFYWLRLVTRLLMKRFSTRIGLIVRGGPDPREIAAGKLQINDAKYPAIKRVRESSFQALRNYKPSFYPGKIFFIRAQVQTTFPSDPRPIWGPLVEEIVVETLPGDHHKLLESHSNDLAAAILRYLQNARASLSKEAKKQ